MSDEQPKFEGHYIEWRKKRIDAIVAYYGAAFFEGKTILEVGAGYGDIGAAFTLYGADVTVTDAREEYVNIALERYPLLKGKVYDLDGDWPFGRSKKFDIIFHLGVLYHQQPERAGQALAELCHRCVDLILETEVMDSSDPYAIRSQDEDFGWDQSFHKKGCRPSPAFVERILSENGMMFERVTDDRCNAPRHFYDWQEANDNTYQDGKRRFWFAKRKTT